MSKSSLVLVCSLVGLGLLFLGPAVTAASAPPAAKPGELLLAETEGDVDENFDSHGADTDEEMEMDSAKMPQDTTRKAQAAGKQPGAAEPASLVKGIRWLGQSAILIQDGKTIYIDPYDLGAGLPPADLILVTHDHGDHLSRADIAGIVKPGTVVVSIPSALSQLPAEYNKRPVKAGDTLTVEGVRIEVVPAYNVKKQFHPKARGYVGYIVQVGGRRIYHAGDTDLIPEMKSFKVDVALLPVGGTYTMDASEAARAADTIGPKVAIPMHYGSVVGAPKDAETFRADAKVPVVILKQEPKQASGGTQGSK